MQQQHRYNYHKPDPSWDAYWAHLDHHIHPEASSTGISRIVKQPSTESHLHRRQVESFLEARNRDEAQRPRLACSSEEHFRHSCADCWFVNREGEDLWSCCKCWAGNGLGMRFWVQIRWEWFVRLEL